MSEKLLSSDSLTVERIHEILPPPSEEILKVLPKKPEQSDFFPGEKAELLGLLWAADYYNYRSQIPTTLRLEDALIFHRLLTEPVDPLLPYKNLLPGKLRNESVRMRVEPLIPPGPELVPDLTASLFNEFTDWAQDSRTPEKIYFTAAKLHFLLAKIHPFIDGNGRVARMLTDTFLSQAGLRPVSNWLGELEYRLEAIRGKGRTSTDPYSLSIVYTERLRLNRWQEKFRAVTIPDYNESGALTLDRLGEDYLLPLVVHMLSSGLKKEEELLRKLVREHADSVEIDTQQESVNRVKELLERQRQKWEKIKAHTGQALEEFALTDERRLSADQHNHPLWRDFISPKVS